MKNKEIEPVQYEKIPNGVIISFDVTDESTFENVRQWMQEIDRFASENVCKVLVGNKCDKEDQRKISKEEGEELAKSYGVPYVETSAKSNICVEDSFTTMAA
jgi:small GTP-binding protein